MYLIAPSILSADFARLGDEVVRVIGVRAVLYSIPGSTARGAEPEAAAGAAPAAAAAPT